MIDHFFITHAYDISKWIKRVSILLLMSVLLSMIFTKCTTGKPSIFGYKPFFIMSESMEPTIHKHQFVLAVPVDADEVQVGDIVTYDLYSNVNKALKETIIHRVIAINDDGSFFFKGDNNEKADKAVDASRIGYKIILY